MTHVLKRIALISGRYDKADSIGGTIELTYCSPRI